MCCPQAVKLLQTVSSHDHIWLVRLTHPKKNTNRHSAPPGSLNTEHILSAQTRKKSANQRPALAGSDQSEASKHEPPAAAIRRSSSDRFHSDKKGSYGVRGLTNDKGHFIKWKGVWSSVETFKVKTINWCVHNILLKYWNVKSFLTDAANQISDNDWTPSGKTVLVVNQ